MSEAAVILLVEDRDDDVVLAEKALKRACVTNPVRVVKNGNEAIAYLSGHGRYSSRVDYPLPSLILLDLKLPGMDGFEVLKWIREQPQTRTIPVVVLTSSEQIRDVNRAYALGANSFLVKPLELEEYLGLGKFLREHWIKNAGDQSSAEGLKGFLPQSFRPPRIIEGQQPGI